ncbi:MAG: HD domain-containing protein [Candidatus Omnitrophica bacterium]|nr:HD domain-containing protein [Candidatus Omnitrophota bacterium]
MTKRTEHNLKLGIRGAYENLKHAYDEIKEANMEMIFRMAVVAESRDVSTGVHLVRIADYSAIIAEEMGLSEKEVDTIRHASPLHDIGKITLPDSILKKKGKLTSEERYIMMKHPEAGARIFANSKTPIMRACELVALTHHERFDGKGYPRGLKGEQIPLYGRIVSLADCFDAFTSKRSYKKAFGFDKSVSMVLERAGTHFDPAVVMAFMRNKEKIKRTWEANRDIEQFLMDAGLSHEAPPHIAIRKGG